MEVGINIFLVGTAVLVISGTAALFVGKRARLASWVGTGGAVLGSLLGMIPSLLVFVGGEVPMVLRAPWSFPGGTFYLEIDSLSAFFLAVLFVIAFLGALFGVQYLQAYREKKTLGPVWFFYNLLIASMAWVITAHNGLLFLMAWEMMSIASFFLVIFEREKEEVRKAGWTYLVATHIGTAFLLIQFILLGRASSSLDFDTFRASAFLSTETANAIFVLGLVGFGTKMGIIPLHVWLPEAHPAAPSHVSAILSGVMLKVGVYGLLRTLTFLGPPPAWWGMTLVGIGLVSGVGGVLYALGQHDLKRLLAYHSVENLGIITLGLGLGLLGSAFNLPALAVLGFAGGLLHVLNHALFKSLLFFGAGSVLQQTGTREMDRLGGLLKKMPVTGSMFLLGSAAIAGLPPLNGFASEILIYLAAWQGLSVPDSGTATAAVLGLAGLALIGGLAAACFAKVFGVVFLGEPRTNCSQNAREPGVAMRAPMVVLGIFCLALGFGFVGFLSLLARPIGMFSGLSSGAIEQTLAPFQIGLLGLLWIFVTLAAGIGLLIFIRKMLLSSRSVRSAGTWDCGYARPSARMQYTSSSFAQPLVGFFGALLGLKRALKPPAGYFPQEGSFHSEVADVFEERLYRPVFSGARQVLTFLRRLQGGRVHVYVFYIAVTLIFLLVWHFGWGESIR